MTVLPFRSPSDVQAACGTVARHVEAGGLIAYPTETVYGLGSLARERDLASLASLKGRAPGKPFLLLVSNRVMAEDAGLTFNAAARALSDAFWPGPLTLVLPGGEGKLPDALRGPERGIAVRWTSHAGVLALIDYLAQPITSTSANRPGDRTAPGVDALLETFGDPVRDGILIVLDGGVLGNVPPSTLVDCTTPVAKLVREGAIPITDLRKRAGSLAP
jgi:L-threonylcarbamoyladenylate synthase